MIETHRTGTITILHIGGPLTAGEGDPELRRATRAAVERGARELVINLDGVSAIDSSGVAALASSHMTMANRGGRLKLSNLSPKLKDIFIITRLLTVFDVYETEAEAIASFQSS